MDRNESCSGSINHTVKEVIMEAESHPVIVPPGENKALYDFAEMSRTLYHAEKKVVAKEVIMEAESHPVILPPGENKALYNFAEMSRALYHAEKKVVARRLKTERRKFKRKQRKQEKIMELPENMDLESFVWSKDLLTLEVVY
ncbi:hypothetical protein QQP08_001125 [Theobroma cacao]|uniref:Uncharacterized protein n=1 Tax=Theobroma cacao TaxID=3641 RepID=A0A061DU16_THECC|nr:Uncharacterized protein TCM_005552 [Theobroma cacao]WRX08638.1 hypothetical protein QQP08_001125 [Theobroma cacao]